MKNSILNAAGVMVGLATLTGVGTALLASDPELITRFTTAATFFGLGSMGLFFVGLAYPKSDK